MAIRNGLKLLIFFLLPLIGAAQQPDITGLWKGFMYNDTTRQNLRYEIAISQENGKLYGYSHQYFIIGDKEFHGIKKLKIKRDGNDITTEEVDLIAHNYPEAPAKGIHQLNTLQLEIKGDIMILSGGFKTNRTRNFSSLTGYVHVERTNDFKQSALLPHLQELNLSKNLAFLTDAPAEDNFVLKPIASDEEVEAIVIAAQKKQITTSQIKTSGAPAVNIPVLAPVKEAEVSETKQEAVVAGNTPKTTTPIKEAPNAPVTAATQKVSKQEAVVVANNAPKSTVPVKETPKAPVTAATQKVAKQEAVVVANNTPKSTVPVKEEAAPKKPEPAVTKVVAAATPQPKAATSAAAKQADVVVAKTTPLPVPVSVAPKAMPVITDPTAATDLAKRKIETIKALYFKSDSLTLTLYDNGEVDGDTVSVIMNGQIVMPKVGLSTQAVKKTIYTNQIAGDSIQLIMYAESLGTLPPNSGLLIVNDGNDRYEIRFSGDLQKSAAIVFRRKKE